MRGLFDARRLYAATLAAAAVTPAACSPAAPMQGPVPVRATDTRVRSAAAPLQIAPGSHVVAIEYEAWFGPKAVTFQEAEAMPVLRSADMQGAGGGYDSEDPHVIAQHVQWLEYMGVDAATVDLTNNVGCIFSAGPVSPRFCNPPTGQFRAQNRQIRENTGNLYPAWTALGTRLKLIPLLGCQTYRDLEKGSDGKTGFEKEVEYFGGLMRRFPDLSVVYFGRPLMLVYLGTPVDTAILSRAKDVLRESGLDSRYTFRFVAGYLDSQPLFWKNPNQVPDGPIEIAPQYGFWSVVDRYKKQAALYPSYSTVPGEPNRPENLTVSIATAAQTGWGCPQPLYCAEDALRWDATGTRYPTLDAFMALADRLQPAFLIVNQFNEFVRPDEGWNAETSDDGEPTIFPQGWGYSAIQAIRNDLLMYRIETASR